MLFSQIIEKGNDNDGQGLTNLDIELDYLKKQPEYQLIQGDGKYWKKDEG